MLVIVKYIIDFIFAFLNTLNFTIFSFNDVDVGFLSFTLSCYIIVKLFKLFLVSSNELPSNSVDNVVKKYKNNRK